MTDRPTLPRDPADPRTMSGQAWDELCDSLRRAGRLVTGDDVPDTPRDRAEGFRYLTQLLAAGTVTCMAHADPDFPIFGRMIEHTMRWGLDMPDCLYLYAAVRGDAVYRIHGRRGGANHFDIQVNRGHYAQGEVAAVETIASISGLDLETDADGRFELWLGGERRAGNWLPLEEGAEFVLSRQYFADWENEEPADLLIDRLGAVPPAPPPRTNDIADRLARLGDWMEKGGGLWERMSRGFLGLPANSLIVHDPGAAGEHSGLRGQAYGLGNFQCAPHEAVVLDFPVPACRHWSASLASWYWESIDYATRQSSLNGHQAHLDADGHFRAVIAHEDPGVANWLDCAGLERGTLAVRFLLVESAESVPEPVLTRVALAQVDDLLPSDTPRVSPQERTEVLLGRRRAVARRFRR